MQAKMDANQVRLEAEINTIREKLETNQDKIDANNETSEVLRDTLVSQVDIQHQCECLATGDNGLPRSDRGLYRGNEVCSRA
jgi:hypothetical protein